MLNAATLAAIVTAVWAHPSGIEYLDKIERLYVCPTVNPCCATGGGGQKNYLTAKKKAILPDESFAIRYEDEIILNLIVSTVTRRLI